MVMHILAGEFKGRRLLSPPGTGTRPMTGLARKSLFDILAPDLPDANVLDLYSGTGTLGLEALSRGARHAYFAEREPAVVSRLRRNIDDLGVREQCTIWVGDIERRLRGWLGEVAGSVDVAFVDPPFPAIRAWDWSAIAAALFAPLHERLAEDGTVVLRVEGHTDLPLPLGGLSLRRKKEYGAMAVYLLERQGPVSPQSPQSAQ